MAKNKNAVSSFCINRNFKSFLNTFDSNSENKKFQCSNCEVWKPGRKLIAIGQLDAMTKKLYVMRFCRACWNACQGISPEMRNEFIERIRNKIKNVSEVKI